MNVTISTFKFFKILLSSSTVPKPNFPFIDILTGKMAQKLLVRKMITNMPKEIKRSSDPPPVIINDHN